MPIWLQITMSASMVIVTLAAPSLAEVVKARIVQPKKSPDPSQPKNLILKVIGVALWLCGEPFVIPPLLVALNTYTLVEMMRHANPLNPMKVLIISATTTSIAFAVLYALALYLGRWIRQTSARTLDLLRMNLELQEILDTLSRNELPLREKPTNTKTRPKRPPKAT